MSNMIDESKYRRAVGIMLLNQSGKVFVGQRLDSKLEAWQMPQGGIDENENTEQAMWREMEEEIGISADKAEILAITEGWLHYDLPKEWQSRLWGGRYNGQMQKWFLLRFTGEDADINIQTEEPEFRDWQWANPGKLPELIVDFKKDLYHELLAQFRQFLG